MALVAPNTELACCTKLPRLFRGGEQPEFETYVPVQKEMREWRNGKRKIVDRVLCSCYVFVRCTEPVRKRIKERANFIHCFLKNRAMDKNEYGLSPFASIPDSQMRQLQQMVGDAETPVTIDTSRLRLGSKVRVKSGRLMGLEGFLHCEPGHKSCLAIRINILGYAKVEVPLELLELVE